MTAKGGGGDANISNNKSSEKVTETRNPNEDKQTGEALLAGAQPDRRDVSKSGPSNDAVRQLKGGDAASETPEARHLKEMEQAAETVAKLVANLEVKAQALLKSMLKNTSPDDPARQNFAEFSENLASSKKTLLQADFPLAAMQPGDSVSKLLQQIKDA